MKHFFGAMMRLSLSAQILIGLGAGIFTGLFLGEPAGELSLIGDIYIRLMQMTVLPYLITALVVAFGQLDKDSAKQLAIRGGLMLVLIWVIMIIVIFIMPMALPETVSASFYSSALVEPAAPFSLADIYFTSNPFESMSRNIVPAVVLFSCMLGVALIGLEKKAILLDPLRVWNQAIVQITNFVISLTPIGVFALAAATAGTMQPETFARLEAYFVVFAASSLLLGFVILPLLVTAVTPFRYTEVVGIARDALLTAFVAHSAFIVLPILVQRSKELFERHGLLDDNTDSAADVLIPVLFNFPNAGKLLTLLFIPFAAWLGGAPLASGDYGSLFAAGIPSYFAKAQIALPYLLDLFGLPHDLFRLYIPTTIITGKFDSMVSAMNLMVFAMLGAAAIGGFLVFETKRLLRAGAAIAASLLVTVVLARMLLAGMIDTTYTLGDAVSNMHASQTDIEIVVHRSFPEPQGPVGSEVETLKRIRDRGTLQIGYDPQNLPFSFFNRDEDLVGFDVDIATQLATSLGVTAEFIPVRWPDVPRLLADGLIDVMPGIWYRANWIGQVRMSTPYLTGTMALAVKDERRQEFALRENIQAMQDLKVAIPLDRRQVEFSVQRYFGDTDVEFVVVETWQPFFEGQYPDVDAFLLPAEHASGWSLLHPEFTVVVPQPDPIEIASAFGLPLHARDLADAVNEWTILAGNSGSIDEAYAFWVLGQGANNKGRRWSIMHDVLGIGRSDP